MPATSVVLNSAAIVLPYPEASLDVIIQIFEQESDSGWYAHGLVEVCKEVWVELVEELVIVRVYLGPVSSL